MRILAEAANPQLWWYVARASGIVGWALAVASIVWGLALSTRALGKKPRAPWLLDLHRFLGGLTVVFVLVHLLGLFLDTYVHFGLAELLVPFASSWKPLPVAWGIVGFYILLAVELTSLVRKHLPVKLWHGIHLASYGLYVVATIHLLTAGTDATNTVLRVACALSVGLITFFSLYRFIGPGRAASVRTVADGVRSAGRV
jgi:predicted ferric reductase